MGNWNYKSSELAKRLSEETIRKGGVEQINAPILNCKVASELEEVTVQIGGYPTLVNYNKHREKRHKELKQHKRERSLKRQIKRFAGRRKFEDFPSSDMTISTHAGDDIK